MFEALEVAIQFVESVVPAAETIARHDKDLASQLRRAANSVAHNTAEANKRRGGDRLHAFRIASGEAAEALTALRLAVAWRYLAPDAIAASHALEDRLQAMLWRLPHPR